MRVIITFDKREKINYLPHQLQGFVYFLIRKSGYSSIHDLPQKLPRFFNFSQLFINKSNYLTLIVSSPLKDLIKKIYYSLKVNDIVRIANQLIRVHELKIIDRKIDKGKVIRIRTETPIILRIPRERYSDYSLPESLSKFPYFYWRPGEGIAIEPFIRQLEARVYKQYKIFTGNNIKEVPIFLSFRYIKTVDFPFFHKGQKYSRPGTLWEFELNPSLPIKLIKFIVDVGLGELNSQGYGFVRTLS